MFLKFILFNQDMFWMNPHPLSVILLLVCTYSPHHTRYHYLLGAGKGLKLTRTDYTTKCVTSGSKIFIL